MERTGIRIDRSAERRPLMVLISPGSPAVFTIWRKDVQHQFPATIGQCWSEEI
jgi:hypothetical protein